MIQNPDFVMLDEPESGVDLENISLIGTTIGSLLEKDKHLANRKKSGLVITHTGYILDYLDADKGHVMCDGQIRCHGNPREILKDIKQRGYKECLECRHTITTPELSKVDQERLAQSGIDLGMKNRCGSFLQMDQDVVHAECSQEGIEVLSYAKAMEKYAWLKDYNWKMVSPEKDDVTKYVAAQKDPKGYVIIAHKGSSNILPIQACLYPGQRPDPACP